MTEEELFVNIRSRHPDDDLKAQREINAAKFILGIVDKTSDEVIAEIRQNGWPAAND